MAAERRAGPEQASIEFKWQHPNNNCPSRITMPFIIQRFSATGPDVSTAIKYAQILAENTPQFCDECKSNYTFIGKA